MTSCRLTILDSGIGGLSVVREIRRLLPGATLTYIADNAGFPYGGLDDATLIDRLERIVGAALRETEPDLFVIACNTASTIALAALRQKFSIPFVGVVPAVKWAGAVSKSNVVGLLGTPATVRRHYVRDLIDRFAPHCEFVTLGSPNLAAMAEAKFRGEAVDTEKVRTEIAPLFDAAASARLDTVILACTHYAFLLPEFLAVAPAGITWLDPAEAVARRVRHLVGEHGSFAPEVQNQSRNLAIFTGCPANQAALEIPFAAYGFDELSVESF